MEKTEQQWEEDVEEEEEVLRGRKYRNQNGGTEIITSTDDSSNKVVNVHSDENGDRMQLSVPANGAEVAEEELEISCRGGFDPSQQGSFEELDFKHSGFEDVEKLLRGESEDVNVNGNSEKCVYFDDDKGMWKCRNCCWTYQSGSVCNDYIQKSNRHLHMLMNVKTGNQEGPCFISETEGTGFIFGADHSSTKCSTLEKKPADDGLDVTVQSFDTGKSLSPKINHQVEEIQPSEISLKELDGSYETFGNKEIENAEVSPIRGSDSETIELDVVGVLEKQNTHDLFCPNCNSCITKRVIVRKRKRKIRTSTEEPKRNKLETVIVSNSDAISADATSPVNTHLDSNPPPGANDDDRDRGPDIFRCLSCFSIFIPTGSGFKLFRMFGDKSEKENSQDTQQIPAVKRNWFSSIFASDKGEVVVEQGTSQSVGVRENNVGVQSSNLNEQHTEASSIPELSPAENFIAEPQENGENILTSSAEHKKVEEVNVDVGEKFDDAISKSTDEKDTIVLSQTPISIVGERDMNGKVNISSHIPRYNEQAVGAALLPESIIEDENKKVKVGDKDEKETVLLSPTPVPVLGETDMSEKVNISSRIPRDNEQNVGAALLTESVTEDGNNMVKLSDRDGTYHSEFSQQSTITTKWDIYTEKPLNVDCNLLVSSVEDSVLLQDGRVDIGKILKDMPTQDNADKDTIITVETEQVETTASQISQNIVGSPETEALPSVETQIGVVEQRDTTTASKVRGLDIIKSIVYGGLIESITSLGVITSAAGADASTANVLALGLANLIGGLFVIGHDLWEVKESQTGGASNQVSEQVDRYQEVLGCRSDFTLHAVVAVFSFLIFGLLPPITYGFCFRESNDRDLKLMAVVVGSLVCIILLAVGKAYVRRPPKSYFKTVMYYVVMGILASGASYVAGGLIMKLLEKLGLFEPSSGVSVVKPGSVNPAWASY